MKRILILTIFIAALSLQAAAPLRGSDRLRELVVFPEINLNFNFGMSFQGNRYVIYENENLPDEISGLRGILKRQPDDIELLLRLGYLLNSNGETNESQTCYQQAEQLCRDRNSAKPRDGLSLTELGDALSALDKDGEAEHVYRKATLVSSNEWRCWVGLGNFLANEYFSLLFPEHLRDQAFPSDQMPSQAVLDYRPSPDALRKAEASLDEASRCFDRAMALAPNEPEIFIQRAGYMGSSNCQNCFFRHFHDGEVINTNKWLLASFSTETVANLQKAADLSPKNCEYISLSAYFEWFNATLQTKFTKFTIEILPDAARKSIRDAMTRLENLSERSDKETAVDALENLGLLNMIFGNQQAAAANFRSAVSLDPADDHSWDMLIGTLKDSASPDELVVLCESRLKYKNSAWNHLLLAKCYAKQKEWNKATKQAEVAGQLETNNIVSPLLIAAIALKQSDQTNHLSVAIINLNRANAILEKTSDSEEKAKRWREFMLNGAIASALNNQAQLAINCANEVLKYFPNDETAREILKNLSGN